MQLIIIIITVMEFEFLRLLSDNALVSRKPETFIDKTKTPSIRDGVLRSGMLLYLHLKRI